MTEAGDVYFMPSFRIGQEWLMEYPGASVLTRVRIAGVATKAVGIEQHDDSFGYRASRVEWVSLDRARFIEKVGGK